MLQNLYSQVDMNLWAVTRVNKLTRVKSQVNKFGHKSPLKSSLSVI